MRRIQQQQQEQPQPDEKESSSSSSSPSSSSSSIISTSSASALLRYGSLILLVVQNCSAVLLMRFTQSSSSSSSSSGKRESFSIPIANLTVEVIKFLICTAVVFASRDEMHLVNGNTNINNTNNTNNNNNSGTYTDGNTRSDSGCDGETDDVSSLSSSCEKQKSMNNNSDVVESNQKNVSHHHHHRHHRGGSLSQEITYRWRTLIHGIIFSRTSLQMAIPAALFTLQNNLLFVALANLEAAVFQVVYQLKLFCTAILMMMLLKKEISTVKWMALVMLFCGIVCTQLKKIPFVESSRSNNRSSANDDENFTLGMFAVVVCATSSAFASVYFEKVLKTQSSSLFVKNIQLAVYGFAFNFLVYQYSSSSAGRDSSSSSSSSSIFANFDSWVWLLVCIQAGGGLLVAVVIKFCDNILKSFATAVAIVLNGVVSYFWFDFHPTIMFLTGAALVIGATFMYSL